MLSRDCEIIGPIRVRLGHTESNTVNTYASREKSKIYSQSLRYPQSAEAEAYIDQRGQSEP